MITPQMVLAALSLSSALLWGVADFAGGFMTRALPVRTVAAAGQLVGVVLAGVGVLLFTAGPPSGRAALYGMLAGVANTVGLIAFYRGLAIGRMSVVAPIAGLGVLVPVTEGLLSGEAPSLAQGAGMLLAICGVTMATRRIEAGEPKTNWRSVGLAAVAAAGIGGNLALLGHAVHHGPSASALWAVLLSRLAALIALLLPGILLRARNPRPARQDLPALLVLGTTDMLANVLYALAARTSMLSLAAVLASLHPAVTVILANQRLSERLGRTQQLGVGLTIAGAGLLSVG